MPSSTTFVWSGCLLSDQHPLGDLCTVPIAGRMVRLYLPGPETGSLGSC